MSDLKRVFITGTSAITAAGLSADDTWTSILQGQSALDDITHWDLSDWTHRLSGEIKPPSLPGLLPDRKLMKVIARQDVYGIHAAMKAIEQSQLLAYRDTLNEPELFNDHTAIFVGSPGTKFYQQYDFLPLMAKTNGDMQQFSAQLFDEVHPMWLLRILPNNVLAYTGITYGFTGPNHNITNHAVGGMQALIEAHHAIQTGQAERAIVVAYDVSTDPQALYYYEQLGLLSARHLKPFDRDHDGTILADGASAIVLESEASVMARQAHCLAEVVGGASASEAAGLFSIQADGHALSQLLTQVLNTHQLAPEDIGLLVAHANGNPKSDLSEAAALNAVFSQTQPPVTGFKWSMGHTVCASGLLDTVLATYALHERCVPGIASFNQPAQTCEHLNISQTTRHDIHAGRHALIVNRGFASMNACVVIKACDHDT